MPHTGTTLCHLKICYVHLTCNPVLDTLAPILPLGHFNRESNTLPKYQTRNSRWHPKFNSYNCNMSFIKMQQTQSLTHPTTHAVISTFSTHHNAISSQYSPRVLQHQKQTQYSMLQIKTLSLNTFRLSPSYYFIILLLFLTNLARGLTTLSKETTQHKHTYVTPSSSLNTNKLPSR